MCRTTDGGSGPDSHPGLGRCSGAFVAEEARTLNPPNITSPGFYIRAGAFGAHVFLWGVIFGGFTQIRLHFFIFD